MLAWYIASIPFWLLGAFFFPFAAIACVMTRESGETDEDLVKQFLGATIVGGIFFAIAAHMCG